MKQWIQVASAAIFGFVGALIGSLPFVSIATFLLIASVIDEIESKTKLMEVAKQLVYLALFIILLSTAIAKYSQQLYLASLYVFGAGVALAGIDVIYNIVKTIAKK